jgi:DNA-binding NarL/FixJ family response regulator
MQRDNYNPGAANSRRVAPAAAASDIRRPLTAIRTLLVDDSPQFLRAAASLLEDEPRFRLVAQSTCGREAVRLAQELELDLILMDLSMPQLNGLEATRLIKARPDAPKVVIVTMHAGLAYRIAAREVQADGFVSKTEFAEALMPLIEQLFPEPTN